MKTEPGESFWQLIWKNKNYRISLMISGIALVWLCSGIVDNHPPEQQEATEKKAALSVKAVYIDAQRYHPEVHIRANTEARRRVALKSELSGRVVSLPVSEGQFVTAGDLLCQLAVEDRELLLTQARSSMARAQLDYDGAQRLKSGGYQSATAIAAARERLDSARAEMQRRQLDLSNTEIRAPFAGVVDHYEVEIGAFMQRGDVCGELLELDPVVVAGRVSEEEVDRLEVGDRAIATLLNGDQVAGVLKLVGFSADDVTRTFPVEAEVANPERLIRIGMTVDLAVSGAALPAHVIPASLLSLDEDGEIGVKILDAEGRVRFIHVSLIGDHPKGVWVAGLPERTLLITVGQEYVMPGQVVDAVIGDAFQPSSERSDLPDNPGKTSAAIGSPVNKAGVRVES